MKPQDRSALEQALRDFEPVFWIGPWGESLERLYEPDGTLYAICLDGPVEIATDRRKVRVDHGDIVILPPSVAVELSSPARFFGLAYTGPYPYHFRERFIQVWGFEHVHSGFGRQPVAPLSSEHPAQPQARDLRHRIYSEFRDSISFAVPNVPEFILRIVLEPETSEGFRIQWRSPGETHGDLADPADFASPSPRVVTMSVPSEAVYLTHREARPAPAHGQTMTPEYRPEDSGQGR